ncbi:unnamed protein product [Parnassius apollo]|uniref:(apollo) hypothetical protein n=1 Tax=Parnassius apollo TaxID=110799 RepID=A0A8S3W3J7_PARAO|nr:unnamed protein product [Parnassius apollo]
MVQTCVVRGCGSSWRPGGDIRFHGFPKNSTRKNLWLSIVPLKMKYYESSRICNLHFQESDYDSTTRRLKPTAIPTVIINQETVSPGKTTSALHEESIVQIAALAVPSTSSDIYESSSALKETRVKRTACNIEDQTSKKQCRKILENLCNLNKLPVSSEDDDPVKIDRGVQVKIKSSKEEILEKKTKILKQKVARQTKKIQDMSSLIATFKKYKGLIPASDPEKLASEALVFQIVSYGVRFKCPIAYFFLANNLSGELLSKLIKTTIILLDEIGVTVRSLTCDGASSNVKAYEYLGWCG